MVSTVEEAADRPYTFVVCAVKCLSDVKPTSAIIEPILRTLPSSPDTAIVLIQNGVGIEEDLHNALEQLGVHNPVLSACAWVDATAVDGGRRVVQHGAEKLVLGYHRRDNLPVRPAQKALDDLCELLIAGGITAESVPDIDVARWRKVLWYDQVSACRLCFTTNVIQRRNASFSTICTLTRATVGEVLAAAEARESLEAIMLEVLAVSRKVLPSEAVTFLPDSVAKSIVENENPKSVFKPSMLVDLEAGRPMEVEAIVGGILRQARRHDISVPRLQMIYAALKIMQKLLIK